MVNQSSKRILFVDDEKDLVEMARRKLERFGYQVNVAYNGQEGINAINKEDFDLIITDVVMPVMDGFTFFKQLQEKESTSNIPVMVLTARANMEESFRAMGVHDFLVKPFDSQRLVDKIELIMARALGVKKNLSIIILANDSDVSKEISELLKQHNCDIENIVEPLDIIKAANRIHPDLIMVDLLLKNFRSYELIKSLRSFSQLAQSKIITFIDFDPYEAGNFKIEEEIKTIKSQCQAAGAYKFIGVYKKASFINSLKEFGIS